MGIESLKVGFIGAGNMGGALAKAAAKTKCRAGIMLADKDEAKAAALAEEIGAKTATSADSSFSPTYSRRTTRPHLS